MGHPNRLFDRIRYWCWVLHPGATAFLVAFAQNIVGIILPTLSCALLLQTSLLESIPEYFAEDLYDASFSFGTSSLLLIELIKTPEKRPGFRWALGVGILLLGAILLVSSGLAVNQIIVEDLGFEAKSEFAPWVNFIFAVGVSCYLASSSVTSDEGYAMIEEKRSLALALDPTRRGDGFDGREEDVHDAG